MLRDSQQPRNDFATAGYAQDSYPMLNQAIHARDVSHLAGNEIPDCSECRAHRFPKKLMSIKERQGFGKGHSLAKHQPGVPAP